MSLDKVVSIIDDEKDITTLFHEALRSINGITIFAFTDPILALEHFQKNKDAYVLVISDFRMAGLNGMELLRKMKAMNKYVRTVLMTAFEVQDTIFSDYTEKRIINGYFQKPVRLNDLIKEVHEQFLSDYDELFTFLNRYCNCEVICYKLMDAFGMAKH